jgi:glycosyltransferase involved in cell wall biosynthesis
MRVSFDATTLILPQAGIGRYANELLREMLPLGGLDLRLVCPTRPWTRRGVTALREAFGPLGAEVVGNPYPARLLYAAWKRLQAPPAEWLWGPCDVFHAPHQIAPVTRKAAVVTTIHDLTTLKFPALHAGHQHLIGDHLRSSVARSDMLIAVSEATARDLVHELGVAESRIRVIPNAAARHFFEPVAQATRDAVRARHALPARYFLYLGTIEPRKNLAVLLAAYRALPAATRAAMPLLLAGGRGWLDGPIFEALARTPGARWLGRVPEADLPALLGGATAFVYPSLYEGFGLPVLEAMAAGTPVVTSNVSSLPEVAGDAALLVDPHDVEALASAMARLAEDEALTGRLREAGRVQAARFSWRRAAEETRGVYAELLAQRA